MGLLDNLRGLFSGSKNIPAVQVEDEYEKSRLSSEIVNLVDKIKKINSFDSSVWNLSNVSSFELRRKSLAELQNLHSSLQNRLSELEGQSKKMAPRMEALEASKWTGKPIKGMSSSDLKRSQESDDLYR